MGLGIRSFFRRATPTPPPTTHETQLHRNTSYNGKRERPVPPKPNPTSTTAPPAGTSPYPKPDRPISLNVNDVKHAVSLLPPEKQSMAAEILKGG